jgi:predicted nucleic acid-binding protein
VIVVDSSVWIDYFNGRPTVQADALHGLLGERPVIVGDLILTEVLCGFRRDADFQQAKSLLEGCEFRSMAGKAVALAAASNYRALRKAGITVRKTIDMLIGSYCLLHHLPLLHTDRDFDALAEHLGLIVWDRGMK